MFIAMNRFKIAPGMEQGFERVWRERESHLDEAPGFREFALLKGEDRGDYVLYASHSTWDSREAFVAWINSDAFRRAHARARVPKGTHIDHPQLETFEVVL